MSSSDSSALQPIPSQVQGEDQTLPSTSGRLRRLFVGPNGVRPVWRLLVFLVVVFGIRFGISGILRLLHLSHHGQPIIFTPRLVLMQDGLAFLCVVAATAIMARWEKRPLGAYGLPFKPGIGVRFVEGLVWGFVAECATMGILYLTGNASFHGFNLTGAVALQYALLWAVAFLLVGLFEEFLFRGYPQFTLTQGCGFWFAAILMSAVFAWAHSGNPGENPLGLLSVAVAGMIFCVSLRGTGNLWFAVGMHAAWDWGETYFFGVADSGMAATGHLLNTTFSGSKWMTGGTAGPEGSVVELLVVSAVIGLLFLRFGREKPRLSAPLS
jgi:membrane protease YdiL (CAAX protease family)